VGLLSLGLRDRRASASLALLAGANLLFALNYHIPDKEGYFLPVYLVVVLLAAEGFEALVKLAPGGGRGARAAGLVLAATLLLPAVTNWPRVDKSGDRSLPEFTAALLESVPPDSLIVADDQFLVWSTAHAQLVEGRFRDRILVTDYLLCLPWYISHLRRHYPQLALPPSVDELVARRAEEVAGAKGWEIGDLSQRYVERIARTIIEANLPRRRAFYNFHDFKERQEWKGLPVLNRGLTYELFAPGSTLPPPQPWSVDYPDPARYRKKELLSTHWRHVAGTFSTSCNRAGIACISAGRYAEAETAFRRALAYDDGYAQVYLNLGVLHSQYLPDRRKRDEAWGRFLELAPDDEQAPKVRAELGR
jgi:tetratricopeptide (TPR) repeat protein